MHYTNIFLVKGKREYSIYSKKISLLHPDENYSLNPAKAWLDTFTQIITKDDTSKTQDISFSSFYSNLVKSIILK